MAKFFTADWHLFHTNVSKYCYRNLEPLSKMHNHLIMAHNKVVAPDDEVWNLGDVTLMSSEYAGKVRKEVNRYNGIKHLVLGNHDEWKAQAYKNIGFTTIHTAMWFKYNDYTFYMMHDPAEYNVIQSDPHAIMLCGHVHNLFKHLLPAKRVINVGVDAWNLSPVSFNEIVTLLLEHNIQIERN